MTIASRTISESVFLFDNDIDLNILSQALAATTAGVLITDCTKPDNPIIYCNPAFEKMTGYLSHEVLGKNGRFLHGPDREQSPLQELRRAVQEGRHAQVVLRNYKKDGTLFWNELTLSPIKDSQNQVTHFVGIQNDITEKKLKEQKFFENKTRLKLATSSAKIGIWDWDIHSNGLIWNDQMFLLYGLNAADDTVNYDLWEKSVHPEDTQKVINEVQRAFREGDDFDTEFRILRPGGMLRYIKAHAVIIRNEKNEPVKMIGVNADITEQKRVQELLAQSELFIRSMVNSVPEMMGYWNKDLYCVFSNNEYVEWFGRSAEQMKGISLQEFFGPEIYKIREPYILGALRGENQHFEGKIIKPNGEVGHLLVHYIPYVIENKVQGFFVLAMDITQIKKLEEDLRLAYDKLEKKVNERTKELLKTNQDLKSEIIARKTSEKVSKKLEKELNHLNRLFIFDEMSSSIIHQLSQPLGAIVNNASAAQLLISQKRNLEDTAEILADILQDCGHARNIIDKNRGLLKKNEYVFKELDLGLSIHNVVELVQSNILLNNVSLVLEVAPSIIVKGDRVHLEQVLLNLIMNAIESMQELSKKKKSTKELRISTDLTTPGKVTVQVKDNGRGFTREAKKNLFKPFFTTKEGGLGLGLPICRAIIETHHGRFWGENNPGAGASFYFSLPTLKTKKK